MTTDDDLALVAPRRIAGYGRITSSFDATLADRWLAAQVRPVERAEPPVLVEVAAWQAWVVAGQPPTLAEDLAAREAFAVVWQQLVADVAEAFKGMAPALAELHAVIEAAAAAAGVAVTPSWSCGATSYGRAQQKGPQRPLRAPRKLGPGRGLR